VSASRLVAISTRAFLVEMLRSGTLAGLAMMPFGIAFRAAGLRVNEYGPKTLALLVGELAPPLSTVAGFLQHMAISWGAAVPLLVVVDALATRRARASLGAAYGASFYVAVNSLALPMAFGDPTPWELGLATVLPSLTVHVIYGIAVALATRPGRIRALAR
jgi:hypothetical protein